MFCKPLSACTVFYIRKGIIIYAATNKDWKNPEFRVRVYGAEADKYGRIYFGYQLAEGFQNIGGINEKGLWYDGASLHHRKDIKNYNDKPVIKGELCEKVLEECSNIKEVMNIYDRYFTPSWDGHIMWGDKEGNCVIIEFGKHDVVYIHPSEDFLLMTNFYLSDEVKRSGGGQKSFATAEKALQENEEINVESVAKILESVHKKRGRIKTVFSNIYDMSNGAVYCFYSGDFRKYIRFDIHEEIKKGNNYYNMPVMFRQEHNYKMLDFNPGVS
jgi:hypothetical protein